ncbi:MAG: hypothetical protein MZV70_60655 [Desulfobacterales bacterium]|nr:hypothetical protein [Desulfobacterales bacterium]
MTDAVVSQVLGDRLPIEQLPQRRGLDVLRDRRLLSAGRRQPDHAHRRPGGGADLPAADLSRDQDGSPPTRARARVTKKSLESLEAHPRRRSGSGAHRARDRLRPAAQADEEGRDRRPARGSRPQAAGGRHGGLRVRHAGPGRARDVARARRRDRAGAQPDQPAFHPPAQPEDPRPRAAARPAEGRLLPHADRRRAGRGDPGVHRAPGRDHQHA